MLNKEIKEKIDFLYDEIDNNSTFGTFVLNRKIYSCLKEIEELQDMCTHEFKNGVCIYCRKEVNS